MSFDLDFFDVSDAGEMQSFGAMAPGKYTGMIVDAERKTTNDGNGEYFLFIFELLDEAVKGRKLFIRCNVINKSDEAVRIGKAELKAIYLAILGHPNPRNASELYEKPIELDVGVRRNKKSGENENHVKGYAPLGGKPAATTVVAAPVKAATAQPWKR